MTLIMSPDSRSPAPYLTPKDDYSHFPKSILVAIKKEHFVFDWLFFLDKSYQEQE